MIRIAADRACRRAGHIEQERDCDIAFLAKLASIQPIVDQASASFVERVIDHRLQIVIFSVNLTANSPEVLRAHQLKLISYRRDHPSVPAANHLNESARAASAGALDDTTPARAVISQLAIPFIVVERPIALFQVVLGAVRAVQTIEDVLLGVDLLLLSAVPQTERIVASLNLLLLAGLIGIRIGLRALGAACLTGLAVVAALF